MAVFGPWTRGGLNAEFDTERFAAEPKRDGPMPRSIRLRSFLIGTYNYMTLGLASPGLTAYGLYAWVHGALYGTPLVWG